MTTDLQSADVQTLPPDAEEQLNALLHGAAIAPLDDIGWIRVTGEDRKRWLNGMVTNSIAQLATGEGCYNFVLNAQGRIQGDLTAWMQDDSILLQTGRGQMEKLLAHLNHFIIMDDVELVDSSDQRKGISLAGPKAASLLHQIGLPATAHVPLQMEIAGWREAQIIMLHAYSPLVARFELWADAASIAVLASELSDAGAVNVTAEAMEQLRILEGTPCYGVDVRDNEKSHDLPQETGQTRALHFTKGCYLGQEIVERIHSRGAVHRTLSGFLLTGTLPTAGTVLVAEGKPVAELTSIASVFHAGHTIPLQLALGIIRRQALDRKLTLTYPGGIATPIALPYAAP